MNEFGKLFKIAIHGESHSPELGVIISGVMPGIPLTNEDFTADVNRRKPGEKGTTTRIEDDLPVITSGTYKGLTTGAPLHLKFINKNTNSKDYDNFKAHPRPGHADYTAQIKYHYFNDPRGGGIFSGRLTILLVAAGVVAKKQLKIDYPDLKLSARLISVGNYKTFSEAVKNLPRKNDSLGGIVYLIGEKMPKGLGEPFFDSIESILSHLLFSIPGVKGVEFGSGFQSVLMTGSEHNDCFLSADGKQKTNHNGGINGGITNGNNLELNVVFKPTPSIPLFQKTLNFEKNKIEKLKITGRHDQCYALRTPVIVEACAALVLLDHFLINKALYN